MRGVQTADREREIAEGLAHLSRVDPVLGGLIAAEPEKDLDAWRAELPPMDLFGCLVCQVIGQQISMSAARAITDRLRETFDGQLPTPGQLAPVADATLRRVGLSWRKAATLRELAARFVDGRLAEASLALLEDQEIIEQITDVPGIGPWTVHGALLIHLRRADVVATGDVMLQAAVQRLYGLATRPSEAEMSTIAEPWHPHGSLAAKLLFWEAERDLALKADARAGARVAPTRKAAARTAPRTPTKRRAEPEPARARVRAQDARRTG